MPRTDSFGGGAVFITAENIVWVDTHDWIAKTDRDERSDMKTYPAMNEKIVEILRIADRDEKLNESLRSPQNRGTRS